MPVPEPGKSEPVLRTPPREPPEYPLTDVHVHLGSSDSGEIYYPKFAGAEYLRHMDAAGVARAAAFPPFRTDGYAAANAGLRDWAPSTQGRVTVFARLGGPVVPLAQWPPLPWQVRRWVRRAPRASDLPGESLDGFGGVKLLPHLDGLPPASQFAQIADRRLPIVIHGGRFVPAGWVAKRLLPRTTGPVIIAHLGAFAHEDRLLDEAIAVARANERIYLDTSGIWDSAFCARAAAAVPDKLLFGSDAPLTTPAIAWQHLGSCIADAGVLRAIGCENFQRAGVLATAG